MLKQDKSRSNWNKTKTISVVTAIIALVISRIGSMVSSRFDDWGNEVIDNFIELHGGDIVSGTFLNPLNFVSALSIVIFLIIILDWYLRARKQSHLEQIEDKRLQLFVHQGGHISESSDRGEIILYLAVDVVNQENRKIVDLDAHLSRIYQLTEDHPDDRSICNQISTPANKRLEWEDGSYQVELKPGFSELMKIKVAVLYCMSQDFSFIHEGKIINNPNLQHDAVYNIVIVFKGKLEGDDFDYRYYRFETEFVCSPQNCILDYSPEVAQFENLPERLKGKLRLSD